MDTELLYPPDYWAALAMSSSSTVSDQLRPRLKA